MLTNPARTYHMHMHMSMLHAHDMCMCMLCMYCLCRLRLYDGTQPQHPLLLAIKGRVLDVREGADYYGPGGPYKVMAGRDASRAFAMMSLKEEDAVADVSSVPPDHIKILDDWCARGGGGARAVRHTLDRLPSPSRRCQRPARSLPVAPSSWHARPSSCIRADSLTWPLARRRAAQVREAECKVSDGRMLCDQRLWLQPRRHPDGGRGGGAVARDGTSVRGERKS